MLINNLNFYQISVNQAPVKTIQIKPAIYNEAGIFLVWMEQGSDSYNFIKEAAKLRASASLSKYSSSVGFSIKVT